MKLKKDFITQQIDDTQFLVPVGAESFKGVVRSNTTAAFIVDCLKKETSKENIVDALCDEYEVSRDMAAADVDSVLATLRSVNAIEE